MQMDSYESVQAIMGPASSPGPRNPVSVAVAAAGVLQPLSNLHMNGICDTATYWSARAPALLIIADK